MTVTLSEGCVCWAWGWGKELPDSEIQKVNLMTKVIIINGTFTLLAPLDPTRNPVR